MVDVQFEGEQQYGGGFKSRSVLGLPTTPGMVRWLMKLGIKDEKAAGYVLVVLALVVFAVSIYFWFSVAGRGTPSSAGSAGTMPPIEALPPF